MQETNNNLNKSLIKLSINYRIVFGIIIVLSAVSGMLLQQWLVIIGIYSSIFLFYLFVKYPRIWIYTVAALLYFYTTGSGEGITALDVISAAFYFGVLFTWFFWMIFINHEKLIRNFADWCFIFFFIACIINFVITLVNGNDPINWLREYLLYLNILYYFPIRHYFSEKKHLVVLLLIFSLSVFGSEIYQIIVYKQSALSEAMYAFQLGGTVHFNQTIFSCSVIFGVLFLLLQKKFKHKFAMIVFTIVSIVALIVTFSRTFWVTVLFEFIIIFFYISRQHKFKLVVYTFIMLIFLSGGIFFAIKDKTDVLMKLIERRFVSSAKGTSDLSVKLRFTEYQPVMSSISNYPLGGNGFGQTFTYYQPIIEQTVRVFWTHNGYLFLMFKVGIPLTLFFLFPFIYFLFKGEHLARSSTDNFDKFLALASSASIIIIISSNLMSNMFNSREGPIVAALSFALIEIVYSKKRRNDLILAEKVEKP